LGDEEGIGGTGSAFQFEMAAHFRNHIPSCPPTSGCTSAFP